MIKSFVLIIAFFCGTGLACSQEKNNSTFSVISQSKITDVQPYIKAMEAANFSCYHLKKNRRKITFDTGLEIELFSVTEMLSKGLKFDSSCPVDEDKLEKKSPVYHLSETGIIMELHDDINSHQKHF